MKFHLSLFVPLLIIIFLVGYFVYSSSNQAYQDKDVTKVIKVIDGDTFTINSGQKIRMIGMNTPEVHHPHKPVECYGKEAMEKTRELIEGKLVRLEKDTENTDHFGRLLRYVYLKNTSFLSFFSSSPEVFINSYLVENGYARFMSIKPNTHFAHQLYLQQKEAKLHHKGLWSSCSK